METINLRTAAGIWSSLVLAVMECEDLDTAWRGTFDFVNEHNIKAAKLLYSSAVTDTTIILNYQTLDSFCSKLAKKQSRVFSTFSVKLKVDKTKKFDKITALKQSLVLAADLSWHYLILSTTALPRPRIKYAWAQIVWTVEVAPGAGRRWPDDHPSRSRG